MTVPKLHSVLALLVAAVMTFAFGGSHAQLATHAEIAVPPMEIPGHGRCAIYIQGGIQPGLWQL